MGGPSRKNHGNSRGWEEYCEAPWNRKSWGVAGQTGKTLHGGGMDIFWNHTFRITVLDSVF